MINDFSLVQKLLILGWIIVTPIRELWKLVKRNLFGQVG